VRWLGCVFMVTLLAISLIPAPTTHGQTPAPTASARGFAASLPAHARLTGYPTLLQRHALSCEAAAASMATRGLVSENTILAHMPSNANPWLGFRGNVNGGQSLADGLANYGIYAPPLARELRQFGYQTVVISGTIAPALLRYSIGVLQQPVEVWVTHYLGDWTAITGHAGGQDFTLINGEHARLAIGYDAGGIYTLDPLEGARYDSWSVFLHSWARFSYMGVVIATTLTPPVAPTVYSQHTYGTTRWQWISPTRAIASAVTVFRWGRPVSTLLVVATLQPERTVLLEGTLALTGKLLAGGPPQWDTGSVLAPLIDGLLTTGAGSATAATNAVQLTATVPYTLDVRSIDPLGLVSAPAGSSTAAYLAPAPAEPTSVRAAIVGPREVAWSWPALGGLSYRVISYRYAGARAIDYQDQAIGFSAVFTRTVQLDATYYAQVLAIGATGRASPATPPLAAPAIAQARFLSPVEARLLAGGVGAWSWSARGASEFLVRSYAYAGGRVVAMRRVTTTAPWFRRKLLPGLKYYVLVRAVASDGEQSPAPIAAHGLIYYAAHAIQDLREHQLPDGRRRWTWTAQPGIRYRLQLTRYAGRRGTVVARIEISKPKWTAPATPAHMADFLQIWAIDIRGHASKPVQARA
jgi:uncharacterized protein YvpB